MSKIRSEMSTDDTSEIYSYNIKVLTVYCLVFTISYFFYNISWMIIEGKTPFKKIVSLTFILFLLTAVTLLITSYIGIKISGV